MKKMIWSFVPLVLGFVGLVFVIDDLKHPQLVKDRCLFVGKGLSIAPFKTDAKVLYRYSDKDEMDLGFNCRHKGHIVVNDELVFPVDPGQPIELREKTFRWLPKRYSLSIPVDAAPSLPVSDR